MLFAKCSQPNLPSRQPSDQRGFTSIFPSRAFRDDAHAASSFCLHCGEFNLPLSRQLNCENINITAESIKLCSVGGGTSNVYSNAHQKTETRPARCAPTPRPTKPTLIGRKLLSFQFQLWFPITICYATIQFAVVAICRDDDDGRGRVLPFPSFLFRVDILVHWTGWCK